MELSRRGVIGGLAGVFGVGAVGFVGASGVDDRRTEDEGDDETQYVAANTDAPFVARLVGPESTTELFDATGLLHVEGVYDEDEEHLVIIELTDSAADAVRAGLENEGVLEDPSAFDVSMRLDGAEVRRIELDESTADALVAETWGGVITLPFENPELAEEVYGSLADE